MLLDFAIGREIVVVTKEDSGLDREYIGVLAWPGGEGTMRIHVGGQLLDIPYNSVEKHYFTK